MHQKRVLPARLESILVVVEMKEMALVKERAEREAVLKVKRHFASVFEVVLGVDRVSKG